jgi:dGTPase
LKFRGALRRASRAEPDLRGARRHHQALARLHRAEHPELAEYLLDRRPPLEAQLIDPADEIAYNTADLDDGFEARLLTLDQIRDEVRMFARALDEAERRYPTASPKLKFNEALKRMINRMVGDLIESTAARVREAGVKSLDDVRDHPERLARFSAEVDAERLEAKQFLYRRLYYSEQLKGQKADGERIVTDLFEYFAARPEALPASYQKKIAGGETTARTICDYLAGMTDNFILDQHKKLMRKS